MAQSALKEANQSAPDRVNTCSDYKSQFPQVHVTLFEMTATEQIEALGLFDETILLGKQAGFSPNIISQPRHMQTLVTEVAAGGRDCAVFYPASLRDVMRETVDAHAMDRITTENPRFHAVLQRMW